MSTDPDAADPWAGMIDEHGAVIVNPNGHAPGPDAPRRITATAASTMSLRRILWLEGTPAGGTIPLGGITLTSGREGIGKSTIVAGIIAQVTRGTLPGEYFGQPRDVLVHATEDDWEPVILPRLIVAGADLTRVHKIATETAGHTGDLSFPRDLRQLAHVLADTSAVLLVLDPLMSIIEGGLDTHKDREVRLALDPLSEFARAHRIAVLGIIHVNKSPGTDPLTAIMGSKAFAAVARSVLTAIELRRDPDDDGPQEYLYGHAKCNWGPKQGSSRYTIHPATIDAVDEDGKPFTAHTARLRWGEHDPRSVRDVMEDNATTGRPKGDLRQAIAAWVAEQPALVTIDDIRAQFKTTNVNTLRSTLRRMVSGNELSSPVRGLYGKPEKG